MKKFNFLLFIFFVSYTLSSSLWVASYGDKVWYEDDFYSFVPKQDWVSMVDINKKGALLSSFLKQNIAAHNALSLGLNHAPEVDKKLSARFNMLMVNEYYMRHFLSSHIPKAASYFCSQKLKDEVYVNHVLIKNSPDGDVNPDFSLQKALSIKDSIVSSGDFSFFATSYSDDPSVDKNGGSLGWLTIGSTVTEFQDVVFNLCVGCVDVVKTDFGYHVVRVDSLRDSKYKGLPIEEYNDFVFRFSSAYIKGSLKDLAAKHDSLLLVTSGVVFDNRVLSSVVSELTDVLKIKKGARKDVDLLKVLNDSPGVVLKYEENFLSPSWFAYKIESSLHRPVFYSTLDEITSDFKTIILRDIVYKKGLLLGLQNNYTFKTQYAPVRLGVLEKAFLSFLVESVPTPSSEEVEAYFLSQNTQKSLKVAYDSFETILLQKAQELKKDAFFLSIEKREGILINEDWFND